MVLCSALLLSAGSPVHADELDDQVKEACSGLSARFSGTGPKSDAIDDEIFKASTSDTALKTAIARASYIGFGRACGANSKAAEAKLDASAGTLFAGSAPKAKRLVQIFHCTEARAVREAASHWVSQQYCAQSVRNFDTYVTKEQPVP